MSYSSTKVKKTIKRIFCNTYVLLSIQLGLVVAVAKAVGLSWLWATLPVVQAASISLSLGLMERSTMRKLRVVAPVVFPLLFILVSNRLLLDWSHFAARTPEISALDSAALASPEPATDRVSVVIPARFEKDYIAKTVMYTIQGMNSTTLEEIILIDDESDDDIAEIIANSEEIKALPASDRAKVKTVRLPKRQGLTRGKIIGADLATGTHILFLDGHCLIVPGSVEAMLAVAKQKDERVVVPVVSNVNGSDWSIMPGTSGTKMFFEWNFEFHWVSDGTSPEVPVLSGGIFLISKKYWVKSGGYDPGMLDWGAENIEQSLRVWMCGGDIVVARDAVIGHIFDRPTPKNKVTGHVVQRNHARAAFVWLDDRLDYFKKSHKIGNEELSNMGAVVADRLSLRHNLKCGSFQENFEKKFQSYFDAWGMDLRKRSNIRHRASGLCLAVSRKSDKDRKKDQDADVRVVFTVCKQNDRAQTWMFIEKGRLFSPGYRRCLDRANQVDGELILYHCDTGTNFNQEWKLADDRVVSRTSSALKKKPLCLFAESALTETTSARVRPCVDTDEQFDRIFFQGFEA